MKVLSFASGTGRGRAGYGICLLLILFSLVACSFSSPRTQNREDLLRRDLRSFHWALIGQDVPTALRYVPAEERDRWDPVFACLFKRLRLLDYRVELVKFAEKSNEASVRVRWSGHRPDSLVVREMPWQEEWSFDKQKKRWLLFPVPDALKGPQGACIPKVPETEEPGGP